MSLLLETIKVKNRKLLNIAYHNARLNASRKAVFSAMGDWDLTSIINIPDHITDAIYKCRVEYGQDIKLIEFIPYQLKAIEKLYLVRSNEISYSHKYTDRKALNDLKFRIDGSQNSDILIVKNGLITDTSYSNIVFFDGKYWVTPDSPLLSGTKRRFYLDHRIIHKIEITPEHLKGFSHARLINAMIDLNDSPDIPIENIVSFS